MNEQMNRPDFKQDQSKRTPVMEIVHGVLAAFIALPGFLLVGTFFSVGVEWLGMYLDWWTLKGHEHAQAMYISEVSILNQHFKAALAGSIAMQWVYKVDSFFEYALRPSSDGPISILMGYLLAAYFVCKTVCLRVVVIILSSHVYLLFCMVAVVTGLVERDKRRFGVASESYDKFQLAFSLIKPVFYGALVLYLAYPNEAYPSYFIIPSAGLTAYAIHLSLKTYKKRF